MQSGYLCIKLQIKPFLTRYKQISKQTHKETNKSLYTQIKDGKKLHRQLFSGELELGINLKSLSAKHNTEKYMQIKLNRIKIIHSTNRMTPRSIS